MPAIAGNPLAVFAEMTGLSTEYEVIVKAGGGMDTPGSVAFDMEEKGVYLTTLRLLGGANFRVRNS